MTFGYSRDDVGKFLPIYLSKGILQSDPFEVSHIIFQLTCFTDIGLIMKIILHVDEIRIIRTVCLTITTKMFFVQVLDQKGVGQLIKIATERGRAARPSLKVSCTDGIMFMPIFEVDTGFFFNVLTPFDFIMKEITSMLQDNR
jgi:pyruvate,orthophosphate dikinase